MQDGKTAKCRAGVGERGREREREREREDSVVLNYRGECRPRERVATIRLPHHLLHLFLRPLGNLCLFVRVEGEIASLVWVSVNSMPAVSLFICGELRDD